MEQIAKGQGESRETPLMGLDISGFYQIARTLHLEIVSHVATRLPEGVGFVDDMTSRHVVLGGEIILYNLVLYNVITDWGCNSPD